MDLAKAIYESIRKWEHAFIDYLSLEARSSVERDNYISRKDCCLELFEEVYIPESRMFSVRGGIFRTSSSCATKENIRNAIAFANTGKELREEYNMLLSSYDAKHNDQNRLAILDACSAMELALNEQIRQYCQAKDVDPDILFDKYRYLKDKFELLIKLGISLPDKKYEKWIVNPRNAVMHNRDIYPSDETTSQLIVCVEKYLKTFYMDYYEKE